MNIGMIFQNFSLMERKTVYENIALPMECWGYRKDTIEQRVKELLTLVDIESKIYDKPRVLSGGQKQRVAIARALALNPKILLCDEATSALDPKTTKSILSLLRRINEIMGITIVLVTHQMAVVRQICQKVSIMEEGEISASGEVSSLFMHRKRLETSWVRNTTIYFRAMGITSRSFMKILMSATGYYQIWPGIVTSNFLCHGQK
jgi:D-methionine transport system ATP-binding protein